MNLCRRRTFKAPVLDWHVHVTVHTVVKPFMTLSGNSQRLWNIYRKVFLCDWLPVAAAAEAAAAEAAAEAAAARWS